METRIGELRTDVRNLLIAGGVVVIAIVGTGWSLYGKTSDQMRDIAVSQQVVSGKLDTIDTRINGKLELIGQRLDDNATRSPRAR